MIDDKRSITNHHWLSLKISLAQTKEELEQVLVDIKCDVFENEPWTKDEALAEELRRELRHKVKVLGIEGLGDDGCLERGQIVDIDH